ncbi:hypothetical protein [Streptomyces sp. NPDC002763]|uniref:hypothetical protein n=1 Tax=Streptomyces sp. NPDC002763 TaxID=3154427 RepID=UPI00332B625E
MSTDLPESYGSPPDPPEPPAAAPSRPTFIATTSAVGGAVVAGGLFAGAPFATEEELFGTLGVF